MAITRTTTLLALASNALIWFTACSGSAPKAHLASAPDTPITFGGSYEDLAPAQRQVVDEWFARYNDITGEHLDPVEAYGDLPLSTRTTLEAVTHALSRTKLTDKNGDALGTALELIDVVDTAHGQVRGASGDHQFRIYAHLSPDAIETLQTSQEFRRRADNTVYHLDYPINFRQDGTPSIQFSIALDGLRADIDVDYRSSAFPALFYDGHLTAANSDVRAGNNYDRHLGRWTGFANWWRNVFGFPVVETSRYGPENRASFAPIEAAPRVPSTQPIDVAVEDYLSSWLVQRSPERAVAYYSEKSFGCLLELEPGSSDTAMAPLRLARDLREVNVVMGAVLGLESVLEPVIPEHLRAHEIGHAYRDQFTLLELTAPAVEGLECHDPKSPLPPWHENPDQKFYGVSMRLETPKARSLDLFQIWTVEEGRWKIIAFHQDLSSDTLSVIGARAPKAVTREKTPADPGFAAAVDTFFETWLIDRRYDESLAWLSDRASQCVALFNDAEELERFEDPREFVRQRLEEIAGFVGMPKSLEEAIGGFHPWDPAIHVLGHTRSDAYTLLSINDHIAEQLDCRHRDAHGLYVGERERAHGTHFGTFFQFRRAGEHAPVLTFLWAREAGAWRIVSYTVLLP